MLQDTRENLTGVRVIRAFTNEESEIKEYNEVTKILENKPYTGLKDFIERSGCSKPHIVKLIKSGAFGSDEKRKKLLTYFNATIDKKEYKPVKTIPSPKEATLLKYGIDRLDNVRPYIIEYKL